MAQTYYANFEGDEIDGKRYSLGDEIAANIDPGTIAYLVQNGRISGTAPGKASEQPDDLTEAQQLEVEALKAGNTADELRQIAADEGVEVETDDNKTDLASKIVAARG